MKKLLLVILAFTAFYAADAQYYYVKFANAGHNPGQLNNDDEYPPGGGLPAGWTTIHTGPLAPMWSSAQTIPFNFTFNGNVYTSFKVSTNGILTFTANPSTTIATGNVTLPNANIPDNSICILGLGASVASDYVVSKIFGTAPNRQMFIQFNSCSEPNIQKGWAYWSIVLEETTNKFYIVDQRTFCSDGTNSCTGNVKLTLGAQFNSTTAVMVDGSPNVNSLTTGLPDRSDNSYYEFRAGVQPDWDFSGSKVVVADYLILGQAPYTLQMTNMNLGKSTVTAYYLNYSINGGAPVSAAVTGTSISVAKFVSVTNPHPTGWNPGAVGTYTIKMWASNLNANADQDLSNDTAVKVVTVVDNFEPRKVLHEVFTSSTCGPCTPGNIQLNKVLDTKAASDYTVIKYQQNFPGVGDPYFTTEALNRRNYYAVNSIPRLEYDGGWDGNPSSYTGSMFDVAAAKPAFMKITATHTVNWRTVSVNVTVDPMANFSSSNIRLFVGVLEKKTYKNEMTNGETEFEHVMKKMLPNETGTVIGPMTKGTPVTKNLSWTFKGVYRLPANASSPINHSTEHSIESFSNLEVIAFVQDYATKEVFQSNYSTGTFLGIGKPDASETNLNLYPNPSNGMTQVSFDLENNSHIQIGIYNTVGQLIQTVADRELESGINTVRFDTKTLAKGIYFVRVEGDNFTSSKKLIVE